MKRRSIALLLVLSMVIGIFSTVLMYDKNEPLNEVNASTNQAVNIVDDKLVSAGLSAITNGSVGTKANPYDIVEIVPYKGMAQLGYLVGGQEPIDIGSLSFKHDELNKFAVSETGDSILQYNDELKKKSELTPGVDNPSDWGIKDITKSGFFAWKGVGKGQYKQTIGIENVTRVPVYVADLYNQTQEIDSTAVKSETPDEFTLVTESAPDLLTSIYAVKDLTAVKTGSSYNVKEENISKSEYIFRYNTYADSTANGYLTYDAIVFDDLKEFYDAKNAQIEELIAAGGTSEYVCYPTYKKNAEGFLEFTSAADGEYYVLFVPATNGMGNYIVDRVRPEADGKSQINIANCYYEMAKADYTAILGTEQQYVVEDAYVKNVIEDTDGSISKITDGSSSVLFIRDKEATGVTKYKAVTSDAIDAYYESVKAGLPADSDYICEPLYFKHLNYYIYIDLNDFTEEELAELELQYVVFVPDKNGEYVVSSATTDVAGDENKLNLAIAYQSELGFNDVTANGQYKIRVNDATYEMVDDGTGEYDWEDATVPDDAVVDHLSTIIWVKARKFNYYYQGGYANNELFKKKFLGLSDEKAASFVCKVHVVTPQELYADNTVLDSADLIYISDNMNDVYVKDRIYLWETLGRDKTGNQNLIVKSGSALTYNNEAEAKKVMNFMANDLDWDTAMKIYYMTAGVDNVYVPIIMDSHIYTETKKGSSGNYKGYVGSMIKEVSPAYTSVQFINKTYSNKSNTFKLYILLTIFDDPIIGYNKYFNDFDYDSNNKISRGSSYKNSIVTNGTGRNKFGKYQYKNSAGNDDKSLYWSEYTFLNDATARTNAGAQTEGYSKSWAYYVNNNTQEALNMVNYNVLTVDGSDGLMIAGSLNSEFKNFLVSNPSAADKPYKVDIEMDNYINDKFAGDFSRANVMNYLLNYEYYSELNNKEVIRILEVEPCKDFLSKKDMIAQFRKYLPYYQGKIEIEQWLSTEYVGKINDLNSEFDIIYFGTRAKYLRSIKKQDSIYDSTMKGLYYYHMGDRLTSSPGDMEQVLWYKVSRVGDKWSSTKLPSNKQYKLDAMIDGVSNLRWNGNDITHANYTDLTNFVKANYAVVLEDVIYDCKNTAIDDSSYLYKFAKENKNKANVFKLSNVAGASQNQLIEFNKYAGWSKLQLELSSKSMQPTTTVVKRERNDREIFFEYKIDDFRAKETDTYTVSLYADNNADGSYSKAELLVQNTGERASKFTKGYYTISRKLMDDFCGCVHWALIVQKDSNPEERTVIEGYIEIRTAENTGKEKVRILQITNDNTRSYDTTNHIYHATGSSTWNLENALKTTSKGFGKYANELEDYKLEIKTITADEFEKMYKDKPYNRTTHKNEKLLENYDMIIYGFGDSMTDISNVNGAWDNLALFMDAGKSMLFTHDTVSLYNHDDKYIIDYMCGRNSGDKNRRSTNNATIFLRDRVGMNRFRIPTKETLTGNFTYPADSYYDKATYPSNTKQTGALDKTTKTYKAIQGYSDWHMARYINGTDYSVIANYAMQSDGGKKKKADGSEVQISKATKVNEGQITKYPYVLKDTIDIAYTHSQYYALDLEDENLVVWYCLSSTDTSSWYSVSHNDARNNYYIYSCRNVMYSGVGHSTVGNEDDEVKLFINTMVAAYNCRIKEPEMIVENEDSRLKTSTHDESIIYYYSDQGSLADQTIQSGDTYKVYVNPNDYNLISEILRVKIEDMDGNDVTNQIKFREIDSAGKEGSVIAVKEGEIQLKSGHHYVFEFPLNKLNNSDGIYTYTFTITNAEEVSSTKEITMGARTLFELY